MDDHDSAVGHARPDQCAAHLLSCERRRRARNDTGFTVITLKLGHDLIIAT